MNHASKICHVLFFVTVIACGSDNKPAEDATIETNPNTDIVIDIPVETTARITQISAGNRHACVIDANKVRCRYHNASGQTNAPDLTNPSVIDVWGDLSCAIDDYGVHCWGLNDYGQASPPLTLSNPTDVVAGWRHACVVDDNGVQCWGHNLENHQTVSGLNDPVAMDAGVGTTCAINAAKEVICWIFDFKDEISIISTTDFPELSNPVDISIGNGFYCALDDVGVHCWGLNDFGQTDVPLLSNPVAVSAGTRHACALDDNGIKCWGWNKWGQTSAPSLFKPTAISAGGFLTCAIYDSGTGRCWGKY